MNNKGKASYTSNYKSIKNIQSQDNLTIFKEISVRLCFTF